MVEASGLLAQTSSHYEIRPDLAMEVEVAVCLLGRTSGLYSPSVYPDLLNHVGEPRESPVSVTPSLLVCRRYRLAGLPGEYQQRNISSPEVSYCLVTELIVWTQYEIQVAAYRGRPGRLQQGGG